MLRLVQVQPSDASSAGVARASINLFDRSKNLPKSCLIAVPMSATQLKELRRL